jgi:thimet oligopeptidase
MVGINCCARKSAKKDEQVGCVVKTDLARNLRTVQDVIDLFPRTVEEIQEMAKQHMRATTAAIDALTAIPDHERTFDNTARELDRIVSFSDLRIAMQAIDVIESVSTEKEIRDAAHDVAQQISAFEVDAFATNKKLFNAFKAYAQGNAHQEQLTDEQRYYISETMQDFKRAGLDLPDAQLDQIKQIKKELSDLTLAFDAAIPQDNRTIEVRLQDLQGVDSDFISGLTKSDTGKQNTDIYILKMDYPTYGAVMENCEIEETRRRYYELMFNRGYPVNHETLKKIIAKRDELACALGYPSYAHLDLDDQMVKTPERAYAFLHDLIERAAKKGEQELVQWLADAPVSVKLTQDGKIKRWDIIYLENQYKKSKLAVDEAAVAAYFPMENTVAGLLDLYSQFLPINFEQIPVSGLWHEDVSLIAVYKKNNNLKNSASKNEDLLGYIFMDLYPRDNKYNHACHATVVPANTQGIPAVSVVIANFPKSTAAKPSLLKRDDVSTFFHEFGHALHAMLGATEMAGFAGTSVKRDFVELPSQMLEEWLWDRQVLKQMSSHYVTGEPLPDDLITKILELKTHDSGYVIKTQAFHGLIALDYFAAGADKDPHAIWHELTDKMNPRFAPAPQTHKYAFFGHLTGYGAKYYGYLWSKVFAVDLFEEIKKQGLFNPAVGQKYVDLVIGKGGSKDPNQLLHDFLGREPQSQAFLRSMGLE